MIDFKTADPVQEMMRLTDGRGVDVAIEALGTQATFQRACAPAARRHAVEPWRLFDRPDASRSPRSPRALATHRIVTTLCPGGKERMRRLMEVVASGRVDLGALVTHRFTLDDIEAAYDLFSHQRDGVLKVAITI